MINVLFEVSGLTFKKTVRGIAFPFRSDNRLRLSSKNDQGKSEIGSQATRDAEDLFGTSHNRLC